MLYVYTDIWLYTLTTQKMQARSVLRAWQEILRFKGREREREIYIYINKYILS